MRAAVLFGLCLLAVASAQETSSLCDPACAVGTICASNGVGYECVTPDVGTTSSSVSPSTSEVDLSSEVVVDPTEDTGLTAAEDTGLTTTGDEGFDLGSDLALEPLTDAPEDIGYQEGDPLPETLAEITVPGETTDSTSTAVTTDSTGVTSEDPLASADSTEVTGLEATDGEDTAVFVGDEVDADLGDATLGVEPVTDAPAEYDAQYTEGAINPEAATGEEVIAPDAAAVGTAEAADEDSVVAVETADDTEVFLGGDELLDDQGGIPPEYVDAESTTTEAASSGGLSGGAIAGIVIGVLAGVALLGVGVWMCVKRRNSKNAFMTGSAAGNAGAYARYADDPHVVTVPVSTMKDVETGGR